MSDSTKNMMQRDIKKMVVSEAEPLLNEPSKREEYSHAHTRQITLTLRQISLEQLLLTVS